jgi:hypothetical protein
VCATHSLKSNLGLPKYTITNAHKLSKLRHPAAASVYRLVGACLICQHNTQPSIKARSSPAAFLTSLCIPSSPFTPPCGSVVPQASASSTFPCRLLFPTEGYDAASEKIASAPPPALIARPPPLRVQDSRRPPVSGPTLGNDADAVRTDLYGRNATGH